MLGFVSYGPSQAGGYFAVVSLWRFEGRGGGGGSWKWSAGRRGPDSHSRDASEGEGDRWLEVVFSYVNLLS